MGILVIGGTGRVGNPSVQSLVDRGEDVHVLTRSEKKAGSLPSTAKGIIGDLENADTLDSAFDGVDTLFLITANGETEVDRGVNAVNAAVAAKVQKIVFLSVVIPENIQVPHYESKKPIEKAIRQSGAIYTFIRPNFFFQNDLLLGQVIMNYGLYTMPVGNVGQNRIDARDIADAAVRALTTSDLDNTDIRLHGPETLTADRVSSIYSKHLGKEVKYAGDNLDAWATASEAFMPAWLINALRLGFENMQTNGGIGSATEVAASRDAVGHNLRRFEDFVVEAVAAWQNS